MFGQHIHNNVWIIHTLYITNVGNNTNIANVWTTKTKQMFGQHKENK